MVNPQHIYTFNTVASTYFLALSRDSDTLPLYFYSHFSGSRLESASLAPLPRPLRVSPGSREVMRETLPRGPGVHPWSRLLLLLLSRPLRVTAGSREVMRETPYARSRCSPLESASLAPTFSTSSGDRRVARGQRGRT